MLQGQVKATGNGAPHHRPLLDVQQLAPRHLRDQSTYPVELRDEVHLVRSQLRCDGAHLLVHVVLTESLSERRKLTLDIGRLLRLQLRRADLLVARTMTGGTRRDATCRIAGKDQANGGIALPQRMPGLETLSLDGRQAVA